ncbi:MAG: MerR family transcriptional regulator [Clostridiales bacterium]|nr:MerR family transcriptional regulator [Clostridiales bacterium]
MTVKEVEALAGMPRANIRFYEAEGLLTPARNANGYRDYSQEDVAVLQRIRLLRLLGLPIEDIKGLQSGALVLTDALAHRLAALEQEEAQATQAQTVCRAMQSDRASYATLDAGRYLLQLEQPQLPAAVPAQPAVSTPPAPPLPAPPEEDIVPRVTAPWRRYFARAFDLALYQTLWWCFLALGFRVNMVQREAGVLDTAITLLLMLALEPLMLHFFGTTPGKWLLGLRVTDEEGRKLSYSAALARSWTVLWRGYGLYIPVYSWYRLWQSYKDCQDGGTLAWEFDSQLTLRESRTPLRVMGLLAGSGVLVGAMVLSWHLAAMPRYTGDLTVAQFAANFNQMADYYGYDNLDELDENGRWVDASGDIIILEGLLTSPQPEFVYTVEDGVLTGVSFAYTVENGEAQAMPPERTVAVLAFVGARKPFPLNREEVDGLVDFLEGSPFASFTDTVWGVEVSAQAHWDGYLGEGSWNDMTVLWPDESEERYLSVSFSMTVT